METISFSPAAAIVGTSIMAGYVRAHDWSTTPLGPMEHWSRALLSQINLMLSSPYSATVTWGAGMTFFYNDSVLATLDARHPDALGRPLKEVFSEAWEIIGPENEGCFLHGTSLVRENVLIPLLKDGVFKPDYYTYALTPIHDDGRIVGVRATYQNTTAAVLAIRERDVIASQLAQVLEVTSDGVVSVNREWQITYVNARAKEILQLVSELAGLDFSEIFRLQLSPDSPFASVYERAMQRHEAGQFELSFAEPPTTVVSVEVRPAPEGIVIFVQDLTEQRRTQDLLSQLEERERENLARLFDQAPVFICVLAGPEHVYEMVNQKYRELLHDRDLIGQRVIDCVPEVIGTGWIDLLDDVYRTGRSKSAQGARLSLSRGSGLPMEDKFVDYIYQPRREPDGTISGIIVIGVDTSLAAEVLQSTTDGVFMLDHNWTFVYLNPVANELLSRGKPLVGLNVWKEFPAANDLVYWKQYHKTMEERIPTRFVEYYPEPLDRWFEVLAYPTHQGISVFFRDVTMKREEEERLRLLEQTVAYAPIGIALARFDESRHCPLIYVNPEFERLTGYSAEEAIGADCRFLQGSDLAQDGRFELQAAIDRGKATKTLLRNYRKNGELFYNEVHLSQVRDGDGKVSHLIGIQLDVTDQVETKAQLAKQGRYDALTGLANRYLLVERLKDALAVAQKSDFQVAVVIFDLDNFKHMNDRFGHMEADRLLTQIGRSLSGLFGSTNTVARLGGDEFALVLTDWTDQARLGKQMERLLQEIRRPLQVSGLDVMITGSAGIALYPQDSHEPEELLQMADLSMYWVKRCGKNSFRFYSEDLRFNQNEPLDVAVGFRRALLKREFELFYQPRVSAESTRVVGFEALIRWNHPERGMLLPAQFVRIAEDTGLINEIGQWVLEEALRQNAVWRKDGYEPVSMSINVSASQIRDPSFPVLVANALAKAGLPAGSLELELTESLLIDNAVLAEASLSALKRLGVSIAIDDFGAGYSGLHYLSRFPVDTIKIDYFFTRDITTSAMAATICSSVLRLGQELGLTTVAEGVESKEQASLLRSWKCSEMQGYMFARPMPSAAAELFLERTV